MARRNIPFPRPKGASTNGTKAQVQHRALSDGERLRIEKFLSAQDAVIQQANVAADLFVRAIMEHAQLDPEDGWRLNRDKLRWEKYPVPVDA